MQGDVGDSCPMQPKAPRTMIESTAEEAPSDGPIREAE